MNSEARDMERALIALDRLLLRGIIQGLATRHRPSEIVDEYLTPALEDMGEGWHKGLYALSQLYMGIRLCEETIDELIPGAKGIRERPRLAIAVLNDFHPLGKKIVAAHLRTAGYNVLDYGTRCQAKELVKKTQEDMIDILLLSSLMLPSALDVRKVREGLDALGARTKLIVGGAPFLFDDGLWKEVGADLMGHHAFEAVSLVKRLEGAP